MNWAKIRKALVAAGGAFVAAVATAWVQQGAFPGWPAIGTAAGLGVAAGWAVWRAPNAPAKS